MIKRVGGCLFAGLLTLSVWVGETTTTSAQEGGDQWFIIDEFSGLDLWSEMTKLPKGAAREAKNIQFRKPGTISVLESISGTATLAFITVEKPVVGFGSINSITNDSDRIIVACSSLFFNSYGSKIDLMFQGIAERAGHWHITSGNTTYLDTSQTDPGRAAEFWRAGWAVLNFATLKVLDYIIDNNSMEITANASTTVNGPLSVYPVTPSETANVQFVNVDVHGSSMIVCLQAGMEPVLYDGGSLYAYRYFGVADSGIVKKVGYGEDSTIFTAEAEVSTTTLTSVVLTEADDFWNTSRITNIDVSSGNFGVTAAVTDFTAATDSLTFGTMSAAPVAGDTMVLTTTTADMYIVDNTKLGIYSDKFLGPDTAGYWLHLPYRFPDTDSSTFGRMYPIDSNIVTIVDDTLVEFRIYFRPGHDSASTIDARSAEFIDSITGSHYQIISAPFLRDEVTEANSPTATFHNGGESVSIDTDSATTAGIGHHEYDQRAFVLFFDGTYADTVITPPTSLGDAFFGRNSRTIITNRNPSWGFPIRAVYEDDAAGPHQDSVVLMMSGEIENRGLPDLQSSAWSIFNITIPFASDGISYRERLFLAGDPQDPNFIVFSEPFEIGAFPVNNVFSIGGNGDSFTGFALIYDWLVIFQKKHTWVLKGDPTLFAPELVLPSEGCIAIESIVEIDNRIIYLSERGWRIFDGNSSSDFAEPIKPGVQAFPNVAYSVNQAYRGKSAAAFNPVTGNIWMSQPFDADTANTGSWLWNSVGGSFSYSDEVYGGIVRSVDFAGINYMFFTHPDTGHFYTYAFADTSAAQGIDHDSMNVQWSTGWMDMGHPQQAKFISDGVVHLKMSTPSTLDVDNRFIVSLYKDFAATPFYADTTADVFGLVSSVFNVTHVSRELKPETELEWLRIELSGDGLNVMDIRSIALRYRVVGDIIRDRDVVRTP